MSSNLVEKKAAEMQVMIDSSGREVQRQVTATYCIDFELVRNIIESAPPPKRPNRSMPIHDPLTEEIEAWEAASDESLEIFDEEYPPLEE